MSSFDEQHTLCFRVRGYYRDTVPGGNTTIASGFLTLVDARKLLRRMQAIDWIKTPEIQIKNQGEEWAYYECEITQ